MKRFNYIHDGNMLEALLYPFLLLLILWSIYLMDFTFHLDLYKYGVLPQTMEGLKGIFFMPFIHSQRDFTHIVNNSLPTFVLLAALIYYYRKIALYVVLAIWLGGGFLLWNLAPSTGSYHIGISGVIYGLFSFLFVSGIFRKRTPMWAISLFVIFLYGSLIWGIFPTEKPISWEGHLFGLIVGIVAAIAARNQGPKPLKYWYEIEQEMGIEPPDLEGMYKENLRRAQEREEMRKAQEEEQIKAQNVVYYYIPKQPAEDKDQNKEQ
ncbi:rhomboid family intramembrane serine protease [Lishizhenia tianjinensis]|nr:rhomboid family intramembrane serine protease [Lishizhenia tianjinensis]